MKAHEDHLRMYRVSTDHEIVDYRVVVIFNDPDNIQHTLVIPQRHFRGKAIRALKLMASHGYSPLPDKMKLVIDMFNSLEMLPKGS